MRISNFKEFNKINEEEGAKENILLGLLSLLGVSTMGQTPDRWEKTTPSEARSKILIRQGWALDSTHIDTLFAEVKINNPNAEMEISHQKADFGSGGFDLLQEVKDLINDTIQEIIQNDDVIMAIKIISSTDKQRVSKNLQALLKSKGYSPDNEGLSSIRNNSVSDFLQSLGISESIIDTVEMSEEGGPTIDQSARYVSLVICYIKKPVHPDPKIITKYFLSKEKMPPRNPPRKLGGKNKKKTIKLGPIKNFKDRLSAIDCWTPGSHKIEPGGL